MIYTLYVDLQVLMISLVVISIILLFGVVYLKMNNQKLFSPVPLDEMLDKIRKRSEFDEEEESIVFEKLASQIELESKDIK